ncbi:CP20A-like protein [Mya arenaria]|uniref:CP20A-like protein n=1 Tax=Mya arenaria TaxID=6604 RepID=A0ABY7D8E0_MYAAR|nr:CP20A-like protein [Mya arenaria]
MQLHEDYGPVASFWWGPTYTVSICEEDLFKQHTNPLIGMKCIQYANGQEGRARRRHYDTVFTHEATKKYFLDFQEIADELVKKWDGLVKEDHIPVTEYMTMFTLKAVLLSLYGKYMKDDKKVVEFKHIYDQKKMFALTNEIVKHRRAHPPEHGEELFLDVLLDGDNDEVISCDALAYDIQEKVYKEIKEKLGNDDVDFSTMNDLVFDPDRFAPEKKHLHHLSFVPFGFAGKRKCPGYRFAYAEVTVAMVTILRKFKVKLVEGQVITPVHGLVTHPSDEVWITISRR